MKILRADLARCHTATGLVVAIDVLRAFTTAAYLFDAGVDEIYLVSGVQEAFELRAKLPGCLLAGEVDGIPIQGFDLGNSPSQIRKSELAGKRVIQRTTAGTQGVVRAVQAQTVLAAALTNLSATVRYIQKLAPQSVTLIQTGFYPEQGQGDEDVACADAIEALLLGKTIDREGLSRRVRLSRSGLNFDGTHPDLPAEDLELALQVDRFDFAMPVERQDGLHRMRRQK